MSTLTHHDSQRTPAGTWGPGISAGVLALVVHAMFFSVLYVGSNWHVKKPPNMVVEMWNSLPDPTPELPPVVTPEILPPPPAPVVVKAEKAPVPKMIEPPAAKKSDIEFKDKKKKTVPEKKEKPAVPAPPKPDDSAQKKQALENQNKLEAQQKLDKQRETAERTTRENERIQALKEKMHEDTVAANQDEVTRYRDLISNKIRDKINTLTDVPDNAEAEFLVTVLPDGSVMDNVKLVKSSGNAAYDSAAERAIYKAQPLPMPQDKDIARMFRELHLTVKPGAKPVSQ
jgi:colicin import membrane protein